MEDRYGLDALRIKHGKETRDLVIATSKPLTHRFARDNAVGLEHGHVGLFMKESIRLVDQRDEANAHHCPRSLRR